MLDRLDDLGLRDVDRAVLAYACAQVRGRGMLRVALPRDATAREIGYGKDAVAGALNRLCVQGVLHLDVRGRSDPVARRANLYSLRPPPDPL